LILLVALLGGAPSGRLARATNARVASGKTAVDPPPVRKDLSTLTAAELTALRNGVLAMMTPDCAAGHTAPTCEQEANGTKLNGLSPLGWRYQAFIHGRPPLLPGMMNQPAWNTCQHSTWFFLSWHRMELYFFERILRKASGSATLTLPYWNFSPQPKLPPSFRAEMVGGAPNPLWWKFRNARLNVDNDPLAAAVVTSEDAFRQTAFFTNVTKNGLMSFGGGASQIDVHLSDSPGQGQIEDTPHNAVHGAVGDGTVSSMSNPDGAGLDPIFWPVHANIDRAWACWQDKHAGSEPKSDAWLNSVKFTFFDIQDAAPGYKEVTMSGKDVINTATQLNYTYDNLCNGFQVPTPVPMIEAAAPPASTSENNARASRPSNGVLSVTVESHGILAAEPMTVSIQLSHEIQTRIENLMRAPAPAGSMLLTITGIALDEPTAAWYQIYLNLPPGALAREQNDRRIGNLSFFGFGHHQDETGSIHAMSHGKTLVYDITNVVRQLIADGVWRQDEVSVTFTNPAAEEPEYVFPPTAPDYARARFASLSLTVK